MKRSSSPSQGVLDKAAELQEQEQTRLCKAFSEPHMSQ